MQSTRRISAHWNTVTFIIISNNMFRLKISRSHFEARRFRVSCRCRFLSSIPECYLTTSHRKSISIIRHHISLMDLNSLTRRLLLILVYWLIHVWILTVMSVIFSWYDGAFHCVQLVASTRSSAPLSSVVCRTRYSGLHRTSQSTATVCDGVGSTFKPATSHTFSFGKVTTHQCSTDLFTKPR